MPIWLPATRASPRSVEAADAAAVVSALIGGRMAGPELPRSASA